MMGEKTGIEWCDHTFNPWIGCQRVSPGCVNCYAEAQAKRFKKAEWGPTAERVKTSVKYWKDPLRWNKEQWIQCKNCYWRGAVKGTILKPGYSPACPSCGSMLTTRTRQRVFCASMADVFEDKPELANWRGELFKLIEATPNLDWLILTKRPEKIFSLGTDAVGVIFDLWLADHPNVWLGTSIENQKAADERIPPLLHMCAKVLFLSIEPQLERIELVNSVPLRSPGGIDWVIVGGESGPHCRLFDVEWARSLRDECRDAGVPFFMKQLGGYPDKRDQLADLPEDLRIREWPK